MLRDRLRRPWRRVRDRVDARRFQTRLRADPEAPILLLSPHCDDAVLDCWGVLSQQSALQVVNVFAGVPSGGGLAPWDAITGARDSAERARERIAEDALALAHAGRRPVSLPFLDAQYRRPVTAPRLDSLDRAVAEAVGSVAGVHAPAGLGGHPDHLLVREYARLLARAGLPVTLYAELPYCVLHGWPHWVDDAEPDPHRDVDAFWRTFLVAVGELGELRSARVARLDDRAAAAKLAALRCYRTQIACIDYGAGRILSDPEIHRFEVAWELRSPARGSAGSRSPRSR